MAKILFYTGYTLQHFSNAFIVSSLLLGMSKIFYYFIFYVQLTWVYNILLLFICFLIFLKFNIHFYLRYATYKVIKVLFGEYFFGLYHLPWEKAYNQILAEDIYIPK